MFKLKKVIEKSIFVNSRNLTGKLLLSLLFNLWLLNHNNLNGFNLCLNYSLLSY